MIDTALPEISRKILFVDDEIKLLDGIKRQLRRDYAIVTADGGQAGLDDAAEGVSTMQVLKVSSRSRSTAVAGAIAGVVREHGRAEVQAIGAGAVNQAVKAVAIARSYLALDGLDVICIPAFADVEIGEQERTAIKLIVEPR